MESGIVKTSFIEALPMFVNGRVVQEPLGAMKLQSPFPVDLMKTYTIVEKSYYLGVVPEIQFRPVMMRGSPYRAHVAVTECI